jgi:hypothetical protein
MVAAGLGSDSIEAMMNPPRSCGCEKTFIGALSGQLSLALIKGMMRRYRAMGFRGSGLAAIGTVGFVLALALFRRTIGTMA